jgi:glycine C-acetyltransferase
MRSAFSSLWCPKGQARIRTQMSAAHTTAQIERAAEAFIRVGKRLAVI